MSAAIENVIVEVPIGGKTVRLRSDLDAASTRRLLALRERPVPGDVAVLHHVPADADGVSDFFEHMRARHPGAFRTVGSTMFETDRVPASWVRSCNRLDEIWVPTRFNFETFSRSGVDAGKLRVMPFGVASLEAGDVDGSYLLQTTKTFKFVSVFELTKRKGWDVLLDAWLDAFDADDDVALVVKTYGRRGVKPAEVFAAHVAARGRDPERVPEILLVEDRLTDGQMRGLYAQCDAFVLPSRGEGWGMPYLEAQQLGLPVIATRWSGQTEFLDDDNAFFVELDGLAPVDSDQVRDDPIYAGHLWGEPSRASLAAQLRRVYEDAAERTRRARRGAESAATIWTADRAAARIADRLREIERERRASKPAALIDAPPADVVWRGPMLSPSGYGSEMRAFVRALCDAGDAPALLPTAWDRDVVDLSREETARLHHLARRPVAARVIRVDHGFPEHFRPGEAAVHVGRTMFESDRLPDGWAERCAAMDELWLPSRHCMETFAAAGVPRERLALVPGTTDFDAFSVEGPRHDFGPRRFTFLSVFEWSARKAPDLLLRAYCEEFAGRGDVRLALRVSAPAGHKAAAVADAVRAMTTRWTPSGRAAPEVALIPPLADADLPALYRGADAFVLPTRGEGFGRPFLEAAAVGAPVVATAWSGPLDFLTADNAYLLPARVVPVPDDAARTLTRFRGHRWAEPDFAALRRALRRVFDARAEARARGLRAARDVRRTHAPSVAAAAIRARLAALRARLG